MMIKTSVVIAALNENEQLDETVKSIREASPDIHEVIVVDDCSATPQPHTTIRNAIRLGNGKSRHIGCKAATGDIVLIMDAHMQVKAGDIETISRVAMETNGWAYAAVNRECGADLRLEAGILRCKWHRRTGEAQSTTGMMGAFYGLPRSLLEQMGGWVKLPGYMGWNEETMVILSHKCGIPITVVPSVKVWHQYRRNAGDTKNAHLPVVPFSVPAHKYLINLAAMYRLLFEDEAWAYWRKVLATRPSEKSPLPVSEDILKAVETPEMLQYGRDVRGKCVYNDTECLALLEEWGVVKETKLWQSNISS